ncbi:MAG: hypothetical protein ACR2FO_06115 [Actinomycetota bacterium]
MTWLLVGLAVTLGVVFWADAGGSGRFWAACISTLGILSVAIALASPTSIGFFGTPITFLVLFISITLILGVGGVFRRLTPAAFACFALSDVALALGMWSYQVHALSWHVPARGSWGPAAWLVVVAASLRLAAPAFSNDCDAKLWRQEGSNAPIDGAMVSVGWWQGAVLAFWVAPSAPLVLGLGGAAVWLVSAFLFRSRLSGLSIAGGSMAVAAALGAPSAGIMAIGLAGLAMALGERVIAIWVVAILPLSLAGWTEVFASAQSLRLPGPIADWFYNLTTPAFGPIAAPVFAGALALVFTSTWAAAASRLADRPRAALPPLAGAWLAAACALVIAVASGQPAAWLWLGYGAVIAGVVCLRLANSDPGGLSVRWPWQAASGPIYEAVLVLPRRSGLGPGIMPAGWAALAIALAVAAKLTLMGLRTGFL